MGVLAPPFIRKALEACRLWRFSLLRCALTPTPDLSPIGGRGLSGWAAAPYAALMSDAAVKDLDRTVRRVDPDRWLASRFIADQAARADVIALYAFNHELARAPEVASEPLMGEIRLTWWAEALDEMFEGRPVRGHPAAQGLAMAVGRGRLDRQALETLIEARMGDLYRAPFASEGALFAYVDATAGALMQSAVRLLGGEGDLPAVQAAGRAWGLAGLTRLRALGAATRLPDTLTPDRAKALTAQALTAAREGAGALPVAAFPAVAYACLAESYARDRNPTMLEKQARLVWAAARGRV
jgi:phytoene synthase